MRNIDSLVKYSLYFLLCWYVIAPFIWINDATLSLGLKIAYAMINYLIIGMLIRVIKYECKKPSLMDFFVSFILIIWFFYSTERDYNEQGYDLLLKMFYLSIDLLSMVFLIDTFINLILNSSLFFLDSMKIKNINDIMKICLISIFSFTYLQIYRNAK